MGRFEQNFRALEEQKWKQLLEKVDEFSQTTPKPESAAFQAELDRLSRITEFLATTVASTHPFADFINPDIQDHATNFENRVNQLTSKQQDQLEGVVKQLNNDATSILDRLSPYLSQTESARAAGQAFGRYRRLIDNQENDIRKIRATIDEAQKTINSTAQQVKSYRSDLLEDTDEKKSIYSEINEKTSQIDKMLSATDSFYRKLTEGDAESASIENQISEARKSAVENSDEISRRLKALNKKLTELDEIHSEVVGSKTDTDEEASEKGLKAQLDDMVAGYEQKFSGLQEQIEGLLPGATSAGLATAYNTRRNKAERSAKFYSWAFFAGIVLLALSAAATFTQSFSLLPFSWEHINFASAKEYFDKLLFKLPIVIPVLWATLTVSKRRSEMHRLAEEYAHKEALAQSYEGFKQQIAEMDKDNEPLIQRLLEVILKAIAINAATTLEGKHGEKMPIQEALEEMVKKNSPESH